MKNYYFEGEHVNGIYNDGEVTIFAVKDGEILGHAEDITIDLEVARSIVEDIEDNPEDYYLQSYLDYKGDTVYTLCRYLEKMPFDKNGIHATGSEYLETNGDWVTEYEDDIPEGYTPHVVNF